MSVADGLLLAAKDAYQVEGNSSSSLTRPKVSSSSSNRRANNLATIGFSSAAAAAVSAVATTGTIGASVGTIGRVKHMTGSPKVMSPKKDVF